MFYVVLASLISDEVRDLHIILPDDWREIPVITDLERVLSGVNLHMTLVDHITSGPATTVSLVSSSIDWDRPLLVANSDQYVSEAVEPFAKSMMATAADGLIMTMRDSDPKWSYVALDDSRKVVKVVEKVVISDLATVGIYGFKKASFFFNCYSQMVETDDRVAGEFYVAPAYNYMLELGLDVRVKDVGEIGINMHGLGVPHDYEEFLASPVSVRAATRARKAFDLE